MSEPKDSGEPTDLRLIRDLKQTIDYLKSEINTKDEKLKEVEDLSRICSELNTLQLTTLPIVAEATIAALNKKLGIGPQTASDISAVNPGVSREDFDAITRENTELDMGLELFTDPAIVELCKTVIKLLEVIVQSSNKELKETLASSENELASKDVVEQQNSSEQQRHEIQALRTQALEKDSLIAKMRDTLKTYDADFKKENKEKEKIQKKLNETIQKCEQLRSENQLHMKEISRLKSEIEENRDATVKNQELNGRVAPQQNVIMEHVIELEATLADLSRTITNLLAKNKECNTFCKVLLDSRRKLLRSFETHQPGIPLPDLDQGDKQSDESNQKSERLRRENQSHMATIRHLESEMRRMIDLLSGKNVAIDDLRAQAAGKDAMLAIMMDTLKAYETDFKNENKEKNKIQKQLNESSQESERLRRENQSHMASIPHFESEIERMNKLLNEKNKNNSNIGFPFGLQVGSSPARSFFQDQSPAPIVVADGGGENESRSTQQTNASSNSSQSSPTLVECPYCSRSYPYHLIEGQVQDCMEDSLYMDD